MTKVQESPHVHTISHGTATKISSVFVRISVRSVGACDCLKHMMVARRLKIPSSLNIN
jgi:hypothetical protein